MLSVLEFRGVPFDELEDIRINKREKRGSFTKVYILEEVRDLPAFQQEVNDMNFMKRIRKY